MRRRGSLALGIALLTLACGDDEPAETPSSNLPQAATTIEPRPPAIAPADQLLAALGGRASLDALTGLIIRGNGSRHLPNEGLRPADEAIQANTLERTVSLDFEGDALRVDTSRDIEYLFPGSQEYSDILQGNLGASTQPFFGNPLGALGSDKVAAIRRQEFLLTPQLLLQGLDVNALAPEADVELDGVPHHRLVASDGPAPLTLFVNASTGTLSKVETLEHDFYQRDVALEIFYDDWAPAGDTAFPGRARVVRAGHTLFTQTVASVTVNPRFEAGTFAFPEGVAPQYDAALYARGELSHQWYYLLDSVGLPLTGVDRQVAPIEVARNVLQLVGASHHSFVVQQAAGLVLVDAPLYDDRGDALVNYLDERFPGIPINYVVASHFHEDHVSGIREVLGRTEATLVVQASVEEFWRELIAAPSTLQPDALAESPRDITILTVPDAGERVLSDVLHPVTLYHVSTNHAADMLLTYEPASNSVFVVDIYSPGNAAQLGATDLDAALTAHAIPTENLQIVGGHGAGIDGYATLQSHLVAQ